MPPPKPYAVSSFRTVLRIILVSVADGIASTGIVFASFEGGRTWALWVCAGAAALAGFYALPIRYSQYFAHYPLILKAYAVTGRYIIATLLTAAVSVAIYYMRHDKDASMYALFALVPPLLLFAQSPAPASIRRVKDTSGSFEAGVLMQPLLSPVSNLPKAATVSVAAQRHQFRFQTGFF